MILRHGDPADAGTSPILPGTVRVLAPAKVNLFLEVLGKRPDGFHEIATLMLAVDLYDQLDFSPDESGELSLTCDLPDLSTGPDNLVLKAANAIKAEGPPSNGAKIHLTKRIPWAAGLGGGSSDAAATLQGLNDLWNLGLASERLSGIGAALGSDVPFFLNGPAGWCTGRGERVTPVPVGQPMNLVLVKPEEGLNTADVYRRVKVPAAPQDGLPARTALATGDLPALARSMHNRLQEPAFELCPSVANWSHRLKQSGALGTLLSGSGSCLFALCRDAAEARRVHDDLSRGMPPGVLSPRMYLVRSRP